ncbi:Na+/H+ antiporter NhaC [Psychrobacillus lasiicapitis]|uniref:Na+/H+ antiporter NhaC n=1 Tax=Psychrobacillus lasiicapitis TaxID=1636719 RepID=A0A544T6I5_9BACI|nr:Na+/H+ antiporter NhaC [Psychrobacillus lasiicapitis]TQR13055.1 Na+/H+ antiporter NhaC [Psychrobacillus lasiicapitis]GGA34851.1 Na+/H+ antiporter NhaC [Psychrobacillus lasiicapitis]
MGEKDKVSTKKEMSLGWAVIPLLVMIASMYVAVVRLEQGPHIPLIIGTSVAALVAWKHGFRWNDIEEMMYKGIKLALPAVVIIMLVGLTIGSWIGGGVVATMIYYGLKIITPALFLVTICVICMIVSLAIGSSWSTMGTIGVAGMGIGLSMGIPAPIIAGAVISGAYFGDKMSPLSDTTNLAAGLTNTNLFVHIRHMLYTTVPGILISLGVYGFLGMKYKNSNIDQESIQQTISMLEKSFVISPWLLLIPVAVIVLVALKVPAIPALVIGIILGSFSQVLVQGGSLSEAVGALQSGFVIETGNVMVDDLFNRGGLDSMMYTVSMTLVAMTFGGILEYSGMLQSIMNQILKLAKSAGTLVASTILACFTTNATCSEQYISIVVPARMFANAYTKMGLHSKNLSRSLEDGGTLTSVFIPWNTCGVFILGTLGVGAFEYAPYAILNYVVPLLSIGYAITGFTIQKLTKSEMVALQQKEVMKA